MAWSSSRVPTMAVLSWRVGRAIGSRLCLHRVDIDLGWDSTKTIVPYPHETQRGLPKS